MVGSAAGRASTPPKPETERNRDPSVRAPAAEVKAILAKIGLLLGSLLLVLLSMELALRALGYGAAGKREGNVVTYKGGEYEHTVVLNSLELRDGEIGPKQQGEFRILAIGDSFTYGLGVEEPETFVRRTESLLRERARAAGLTVRYRVVNGGVGNGPRFQTLWLWDVGLQFEPDLVVHTLYIGNDLYDDLQEPVNVGRRKAPGEDSLGARGFRATARKSVFLDWMWGRLTRVPVFDRMLFNAGYRYESRGLFLTEQPELERRAWPQMLDRILQNVRALKERGIETFVLIVPTPDQIRYGANRPTGQDYRLPNGILNDFLTKHSVRHIDLLPLMEQHPDRNSFYYIRDLHWTGPRPRVRRGDTERATVGLPRQPLMDSVHTTSMAVARTLRPDLRPDNQADESPVSSYSALLTKMTGL